MGMVLSRLWFLSQRRALVDTESQGSSSSEHSTISTSASDTDTTSSSANGFILQAPILDGGSPIQRLPQDLILKIYSFLDVVSLCRCAQVSKAWHDLALYGHNWQHVDLFEFQVAIEGTVVERMSKQCGGFLRTLSLRDCEHVEDDALRTFAEYCHYIEKLVLSKCYKITDRTAESLSQNCPNLRHLDLSSCRNITNTTCSYISEGCPELEHVDFSYCSITVEGVKVLTSRCQRLKSINVKHCVELGDEALQHIGENCPDLETLNVQGCKQLTDAGLALVCENCSTLQRLSISGCEGITDATLKKLGACCKKFRVLEAVGCSHFTDAGFQALANGCNNLQRMDLEECVLISDTTLVHLSLNCPNLQRLVLSHCERITDIGIRHLVSGATVSETLQVLELDNCPLITDQSLDLLRSCNALRRLEIFDCQMVSRSGIHKLERLRPDVKVHAFFPPHTPPPQSIQHRRNICRCCTLV